MTSTPLDIDNKSNFLAQSELNENFLKFIKQNIIASPTLNTTDIFMGSYLTLNYFTNKGLLSSSELKGLSDSLFAQTNPLSTNFKPVVSVGGIIVYKNNRVLCLNSIIRSGSVPSSKLPYNYEFIHMDKARKMFVWNNNKDKPHTNTAIFELDGVKTEAEVLLLA
ncbi:hypothetical protein [Photobacterium leiognathi]|uniref:hypothetical protein n=1 Tax=Photobacterium leiognathi TaxID=553611 RepID=UPI002982426A|nr:hypothetical protein [Photobacterium leiognathi]